NLEAVIERFRLDQAELSDGRHEYLLRIDHLSPEFIIIP
ncbi:hypothetical protein E3A20_23310, partial [Planctomyces bekefii]